MLRTRKDLTFPRVHGSFLCISCPNNIWQTTWSSHAWVVLRQIQAGACRANGCRHGVHNRQSRPCWIRATHHSHGPSMLELPHGKRISWSLIISRGVTAIDELWRKERSSAGTGPVRSDKPSRCRELENAVCIGRLHNRNKPQAGDNVGYMAVAG